MGGVIVSLKKLLVEHGILNLKPETQRLNTVETSAQEEAESPKGPRLPLDENRVSNIGA